jgi:succinate dehydrogenase/fumarate reductase flavoprotein subunit
MKTPPEDAVSDAPPPEAAVCDVLVIGSGASGFATALTARGLGLDVMMVDKAAQFGGTTVSSAGVIWVPGSRQAVAAGKADNPADVLAYLAAEGGNALDRAKAEVYARRAADILAWFEDHTALRYALAPAWPDYHPNQPGGSAGGRSLGPVAFDGRTLGAHFPRLRLPLASTMILGGMIVGREDLIHFYGMQRSWTSFVHVGRLFARYCADRLSYSRGTRLSNGSALIAMLAHSAFSIGVTLHLNAPCERLTTDEAGRVTGAIIAGRSVTAKVAVVLASGGFPGSASLRARFYEHVAQGRTHHTLAPAENTGDGLVAAGAVGAAVAEVGRQPAAWTPVSLVPMKQGLVPFPHFFDRGKAGYIAVDRRGRRFVSEAKSYHDFVPAMIAACAEDGEISCHLICDAEAIKRYGLGMAPPAPGSLAPHVRSGYIKRGESLRDLAGQCGIDPAGLEQTVEAFNLHAEHGEDPAFDKGVDVYERFNGSAGQNPNPCVAPLKRAPFYAIKLYPGDIGSFVGLRTDAEGRALRDDGGPIPGLFVVGNDAASFMGGAYPGAGITLGPALVFGHLAGQAIAAEAAAVSPPRAGVAVTG